MRAPLLCMPALPPRGVGSPRYSLGCTPTHTAAIMKALLADIGGSQWRVRESAALALADLLQEGPAVPRRGLAPSCQGSRPF